MALPGVIYRAVNSNRSRCLLLIHVGVQQLGIGDIGLAAGLIASFLLRQSAHVVSIRIVGIQLDGLIAILDRQIVLRLFSIGVCPLAKCPRIVIIELDGLRVVLDGGIDFFFLAMGVTAVGEGLGVLRIQLHGVVIVRDRAVELPFLFQRKSATPESLRAIRIVFDGLIVVVDRGVKLAVVG